MFFDHIKSRLVGYLYRAAARVLIQEIGELVSRLPKETRYDIDSQAPSDLEEALIAQWCLGIGSPQFNDGLPLAESALEPLVQVVADLVDQMPRPRAAQLWAALELQGEPLAVAAQRFQDMLDEFTEPRRQPLTELTTATTAPNCDTVATLAEPDSPAADTDSQKTVGVVASCIEEARQQIEVMIERTYPLIDAETSEADIGVVLSHQLYLHSSLGQMADVMEGIMLTACRLSEIEDATPAVKVAVVDQLQAHKSDLLKLVREIVETDRAFHAAWPPRPSATPSAT